MIFTMTIDWCWVCESLSVTAVHSFLFRISWFHESSIFFGQNWWAFLPFQRRTVPWFFLRCMRFTFVGNIGWWRQIKASLAKWMQAEETSTWKQKHQKWQRQQFTLKLFHIWHLSLVAKLTDVSCWSCNWSKADETKGHCLLVPKCFVWQFKFSSSVFCLRCNHNCNNVFDCCFHVTSSKKCVWPCQLCSKESFSQLWFSVWKEEEKRMKHVSESHCTDSCSTETWNHLDDLATEMWKCTQNWFATNNWKLC